MISSMRVVAGLGAAALAFSLLSPTPGRADSGDPIQQAYGINYACAGIGKASRADPRTGQSAVGTPPEAATAVQPRASTGSDWTLARMRR